MQIEVPSDKYESAIQAMQERIRRGEVPEYLILMKHNRSCVRDTFTYEQAKKYRKSPEQ